MKTSIITLGGSAAGGDELRPAARLLSTGGIIIYPTETLYGIGADQFSGSAVDRIFKIKGRERGVPIPLIIGSPEMLGMAADEVPEEAALLMKKFWPGPLTIIFRAVKSLPENVHGGTGKVGVRLPGSETARRLCAAFGGPVTATSANKSGEKGIRDPGEVRKKFINRVDMIIDGGITAGGAPSTVVEPLRSGPVFIRRGAVPEEEIRLCLERRR